MLNPLSGVGIFAVDMYQGDPNNTPYTDNNGGFHAGAGAFEALQGNVCLGDNNNIAYTAGTGVSNSVTTNKGTEVSAPAGSYLWVWYVVTLSDQFGQQFSVEYRYRFYATEVDLLTKVKPCPDGTCHHDGRGPYPYLKMPKFEYAITGPAMDYRSETCYDLGGGVNQARISSTTRAARRSTTTATATPVTGSTSSPAPPADRPSAFRAVPSRWRISGKTSRPIRGSRAGRRTASTTGATSARTARTSPTARR